MTVGQFVNVTGGDSYFVIFGQDKTPLRGYDFKKQYRKTEIWRAKIAGVNLELQSLVENHITFNGIVCRIFLKETKKKEGI